MYYKLKIQVMNRMLVFIFSFMIILMVGCQKDEKKIEKIDDDFTLPKIEQPGGYFFIGNPNNDQQKIVDTIAKSDIEFEKPITFVFDKNGNLIKIINKINSIYTILIENTILKGQAEFYNKRWIFEYDSNLNLLSNYQININTGDKFGFLYQYDIKNRLIRKEVLAHNYEAFDIYLYTYVENGNVKVTAFNYDYSYPAYFEYNTLGILIWQCQVKTNGYCTPPKYMYYSIWYDNAKKIVREEKRNYSDSTLFWFATHEFQDNILRNEWEYSVYKDFAINTTNSSILRFKGDTVLVHYKEYNTSGTKIACVFSTLCHNQGEPDNYTYYYFIQIKEEYDNSARKISEIHYNGDFRFNSIEYRFGDYLYDETNKTLTQRVLFDSNNQPVYRYTYEYTLDTVTGKYKFFRENCIDVLSGQLIWYIDENGIKRKPDGSVY